MTDTYLLTLTAYDRDAAAPTTLYFASVDYATAPTDTPASVVFEGVITGFVFSRSLFAPGRIGGGSASGEGAVTLRVPQQWRDSGFFADLLAYAVDGRAFTLERIASGGGYADRVTIASGTAADLAQAGPGELSLRVHDRAEDLRDTLLVVSRYAGTGGFEGGVELQGRPRPLVFGRVFNAPTVPVDPANLWFDVNDGQVEAIEAVRDNGVALTASGSNPPASGSYYADLSNGRVRLGDDPVGQVTVDVKGAAPSGAWKDDLGDVVRHVVTAIGGLTDPGDLDTATFTAIATDRPGVIGYATGSDEISVADFLDQVVGGQGAAWYFDRLDRFALAAVKAATASAETDAAIAATVTDYHIAARSLRRRPVGIPPSTINAQYRIAGVVQDADGLADSVGPDDRAAYSTPFLVANPSDTAQIAAIATAHLRARPLDVATYLYAAADAVDVADDLLDLLDGLAFYTGRTDRGFGTIGLNAEVWLAHGDYGLAAGAAARVAGYRLDMSGLQTLEVLVS
jgi:hypothetical protein